VATTIIMVAVVQQPQQPHLKVQQPQQPQPVVQQPQPQHLKVQQQQQQPQLVEIVCKGLWSGLQTSIITFFQEIRNKEDEYYGNTIQIFTCQSFCSIDCDVIFSIIIYSLDIVHSIIIAATHTSYCSDCKS
jgi:hypothetical protein